ncbi:quinon protein alcohol dehydrogenase-like superfamily [Leucosporidium creatinivorum]|uniref:Quinon protein alcohol dehydrogenase-like superfamily n=1 Tax=Leucosporidium creatinivorum TaxID=106004 RepID=A0A1Y2EPY1_9BASI|nr:quinon protein alcohol dehydrogenase-like superfamily [Leucosporidium creatinivorum]
MPAETPKHLSSPLPSAGGAKQHWSLDVAFPVYAMAFTEDKTVLLGGGGGSSRTGVKNRLSLHKITPATRSFDLVHEYELSKTEDAPMSVAVEPTTKTLIAGINSAVDKLKEGTNENLRVFEYDDEAIKYIKQKQTITSVNEDHYQKVATFSRSASSSSSEKADEKSSTQSLLAIGSTNSQLSLLTFPELEEVFPPIEYEGEELFDVDFNDDTSLLLGASSSKLCVWSTKKAEGESAQEAVQVIERPVLKKTLACTFRAAKFGRHSTSTNLYTIVNASPSVRSRKPGPGEKKSFVSLWDTKTWTLKKTRTVSQKPVTAFDVSDDGTLLAYGSSDLSVGVLDAVTLRPILHILHAHDFPVTSLKFNPSGTLLLSGSADNSVRVVEVPSKEKRGGSSTSTLTNFLLTLFILLLAVYIQRSYGEDLLKAAGVA